MVDCIYQTQSIDIKVFSSILNCSNITIQRYIIEMFGDDSKINSTLLNKESYDILRKNIINQSIAFKIFTFYLSNTINEKKKSFKLFLRESFISTSYAFVVRKKIINFLKKYDLYLNNSCITGNMQRVRFLIVVTQHFFDEEIMKITPKNNLISCRTITEIKKVFNMHFSTDDEHILYLFICFSLEYGDKFPIDPEFIKEKLLISKAFIDKVLKISLARNKNIPKNEKLFILMVFLIQSGYSPNSKIDEIWGIYMEKFIKSRNFTILDNLFKKFFSVSLLHDQNLNDALFSLLWRGRRPIHTLIPRKFIYLNKNELEIYTKVKKIISIYQDEISSPIYLVKSDLKIFSRRLGTILNLKAPLIKVGYMCSKPIERDLTIKIIQKKFGNFIELFVYKDEENYSDNDKLDYILMDNGMHSNKMQERVYYISSPPSESQLDHIWKVLKNLK